MTDCIRLCVIAPAIYNRAMKHKVVTLICVIVIVVVGLVVGLAYMSHRSTARANADNQRQLSAQITAAAELQKNAAIKSAVQDQCMKDAAIYAQVPAASRAKLPPIVCDAAH